MCSMSVLYRLSEYQKAGLVSPCSCHYDLLLLSLYRYIEIFGFLGIDCVYINKCICCKVVIVCKLCVIHFGFITLSDDVVLVSGIEHCPRGHRNHRWMVMKWCYNYHVLNNPTNRPSGLYQKFYKWTYQIAAFAIQAWWSPWHPAMWMVCYKMAITVDKIT